jgi:hypothetical protein
VAERSPRDEVRELVEIALLGEGVLQDAEEHRIVKLAVERGLTPLEAQRVIDATLDTRSGRRAGRAAHASASERDSSDASKVAWFGAKPAPPREEAFICTGCLARVPLADVTARRAERTGEGRVHCASCLSKLVAGLLCSECYLPASRFRDITRGERVVHAACVPPS